MNKKRFENIFIVVVYRNTEDVIELIQSIKENVSDYKVIIVNNYYDEKTKTQFEKIASENECDFINCENRGYGAGNNEGIRLAIKKYCYDFIIISNPDIVIKKFPQQLLKEYSDGVVGGTIYNLKNQNQNPMLVRNSRFINRMLYEGIKNNSNHKLFVGKAINKIQRVIKQKKANGLSKKKRRIYQVHGSFLILPKNVIDYIGAPYDENMFLFGEEGYLAYLLEKQRINTYYCPEIEVLHKEDGSMKFRNDINDECIKANIYFFEKYYFNK